MKKATTTLAPDRHQNIDLSRPTPARKGTSFLSLLMALMMFFVMSRFMMRGVGHQSDPDMPMESMKTNALNSIPAAEEQVRKDPDNPWAYQNLGEQYFWASKFDKAIEALTKTINKAPNAAYEAHLYRARCYMNLKQYDKALPDFLVETKDKYPFAGYRGAGICEYKLGYYQNAVDNFSGALDAIDNEPEVTHDRGMAYEKLGEHDLAAADFRAHATIKCQPEWIRPIAEPLFGNALNEPQDFWLK